MTGFNLTGLLIVFVGSVNFGISRVLQPRPLPGLNQRSDPAW